MAVFRNPRQPSPSDPIALLPGGPGAAGSAIAAVTAPVLDSFTTRDLILIDERGTGHSEPHVCTGAERAFGEALAADLPGPRFLATVERILLDCRHEMDEQRVSADAFGTSLTVEDLDSVRRALGIERWNLHGISYDTRTVMTYAARHPQAVRTMVLDSVVDLHATVASGAAPGYAAAIAQVIRLCNADSVCAKAHPHLRATLRQAMERLQERPLVVPMNLTLELPGNRLVLNRGDFEWVLFMLLYQREEYGRIPALLEAVRDGRVEQLTPVLERQLFAWHARAVSLFTLAAVVCRDTPNAETAKHTAGGFQWLELQGVCPHWSDAPPTTTPVVPRRTRVPTLILSGEADPITPPRFAGEAARALGSSARWVRFPATGHGVAAQSECARTLIGAFIGNPDSALDAHCASHPAPISFD